MSRANWLKYDIEKRNKQIYNKFAEFFESIFHINPS